MLHHLVEDGFLITRLLNVRSVIVHFHFFNANIIAVVAGNYFVKVVQVAVCSFTKHTEQTIQYEKRMVYNYELAMGVHFEVLKLKLLLQ